MLSLSDLLWADSATLLPNALFTPGPQDGPALEALSGRLEIASPLLQWAPPVLTFAAEVRADPHLFPAFAIDVSTEGDRLVPRQQSAIRCFRNVASGCWWDVLVQSGRTWSVEGDHGWSRAAFPFSLFNPLENDSYHG